MTADAIYLGGFSGVLIALFGLNIILARLQHDSKFLLINLVVLGIGCFFIIDKHWLAARIGLPELKIWLAVGVCPLLIAMQAQSYLLRKVTDMREDAPRIDKFLKSICILQGVLAVAFAAPIILDTAGMHGPSMVAQGWLLPIGFGVAAGLSSLAWLVSLMFTPSHVGEWRLATTMSTILFAAFLILYSLIAFRFIDLSVSLTAAMRLAVLGSVACIMLAMHRRAEFVEAQRDRVDAARRERDADWEHRQHSRQQINQAHLMQVLKREKELEAELRKREVEQMDALMAAKEAADETARNKAQFLAFMSHEIRTPLNGIMGMVRLLMSTNINEQQRDYIETLNYSGDALLSLVNDTLDISKIEAGQLVLESIDFDLQRLVDSIIMLMTARASEKNLQIRSEIDPAVPRNIKSDPTRLRQILLNLVNNALKFTELGGVVVAVRLIPAQGAGVGRLRFEIRDTGPGISQEGCSRLFKQYSQVDASTTRLHGGTGLGLSICKQLVEAMEGDIGVESVLGKGSVFWFVLDCHPSASQAVPQPRVTAATPSLSAMVVEDNEIHQKVIGGYLRMDGHDVVMVGSAEDALTKLDQKHFDVLLMDVNLPNMNGNDATRAIRKHPDPVKATVPIIAITGNTSPLDIDECRLAGMDDFVGKPVDPEALRRTVLATNAQWIEKLKTSRDPISGLANAPLRILVVDDNQINQKVIGGFLQLGGHDLVISATGEDAVVQAVDGSFDLILMDVRLPGIDGLETTRRIRALPSQRARRVSIIAITGDTGRDSIEACKLAGMDDFVGKPVNPEKLEEIISRIPRRAAETSTAIPVQAAATGISLDDYLPDDKGHVQLLDEAVLNRLRKAFDRKTLSGLIDDMLAESQPLIDGMSEMAGQQDWREVRAKAHALKGMAMTLGVIGVGEIAADIESSVQRGETPAALEVMLHDLRLVFDQSSEALDLWRTENMPVVA